MNIYDSNKTDENNNIEIKAKCSDTLAPSLIDDCWIEIFKYCSLQQLIGLYKVSRRFQSLINEEILPYRNVDFAEIPRASNNRYVLKLFGPFVTNLSISIHHIPPQPRNKSPSNELLHQVTQHCKADKLKYLKIQLDFEELKHDQLDAFATKLCSLRKLSLTATRAKNRATHSDSQLNALLRHSHELESLDLTNFIVSGEFLATRLSSVSLALAHLDSISFENCSNIDELKLIESAEHLSDTLQSFIWRNSSFAEATGPSETIRTLCSILGNNFQHLRSVGIHMNYRAMYCTNNNDPMQDLLKLKILTRLSIGCGGACACNNLIGLLKRMSQLEHLTVEAPPLINGRIPSSPCARLVDLNFHNILPHLPKLEYLRLVHVSKSNENLLGQVNEHLLNLRKLHLIGYGKLNDDKLMDFVKEANSLQILNIRDSKIRFTRDLYVKLLSICQSKSRFLRILVHQEVKKAIFQSLGGDYQKETLQVWSDDSSF